MSQQPPRVENIYGHGKRLAWISRHLAELDPDQARILEVGCGTGAMLSAPLARQGYRITGVDQDEASIRYGLALFHALPSLELSCQDARQLPPRQFDALILSEVLEHLTDPAAFIRELLPLVRPGGLVLLTVPNGWGAHEWESALWRLLHLESLLNRSRVTGLILRLKDRLGLEKDFVEPSTLHHSPHITPFSGNKLRHMVRSLGLQELDFRGSVALCGPLSNLLFTGLKPVMRFNNWLGDRLSPMAAGFYLAARVGGE